jgi:hypothetical protein
MALFRKYIYIYKVWAQVKDFFNQFSQEGRKKGGGEYNHKIFNKIIARFPYQEHNFHFSPVNIIQQGKEFKVSFIT